MKRNLIIALSLLIVALWLAACTTSQSPQRELPQQELPQQKLSQQERQQPQPVIDEEHAANQSGSAVDQATSQASPDPVAPVKEKKRPPTRIAENDETTAELAQSQPGSSIAVTSVVEEQRKQESASIKQLTKDAAEQAVLAQPVAPASRSSVAGKLSMMQAAGIAAGLPPNIRFPSEPLDRENYAHFDDHPVLRVAEKPVSTFSIDVDTGSYTNTRRILHEGRLPAKDVVRVEEFINYFNYDYPGPENKSVPFNVVTEVGPTPWNPQTHLLHVGIKGYQVPQTSLPPSNLVFLVDVSGSMHSANKLPLLKKSLQLLTQKLRAQDRISLVVYAGASGVVLEPTAGTEKAKVLTALESLTAGGSTNGAAGIRLAYLKAQQAFISGGINRVILA
ncbi:VWA domain-containing protein, partial [Kaarinaea lacus]